MNGETLCRNIPRNATREQLIRVAVGYIEAPPQRIHEPSANLAIEAMQIHHPSSTRCPRHLAGKRARTRQGGPPRCIHCRGWQP
jgi:hypothetical protein